MSDPVERVESGTAASSKGLAAIASHSGPPADGGISLYDRDRGAIVRETVLGEGGLRFLYGGSPLGEAARRMLRRRAFSAWYGRRMRKPRAQRIRSFAETLAIDLAEAEKPLAEYRSLNDFFTRRLKEGARPFPQEPDVLGSPADSRVLAFPALEGVRLPVKGGGYTLDALLDDGALASRFAGGTVIVLRLAPPDYHRFHFPEAGTASPSAVIPGLYDSVSPLALRRDPALFCRNQRERSLLETERFGTIAFLEVGAMCVGTIVQTYAAGKVERGQEKGYFCFGGSTVVLVLERGVLALEEDIACASAKGLEVKLRCGSPLGRRA